MVCLEPLTINGVKLTVLPDGLVTTCDVMVPFATVFTLVVLVINLTPDWHTVALTELVVLLFASSFLCFFVSFLFKALSKVLENF